jgi:uncharacterized protein
MNHQSAAASRVQTVDILRGFALFGIMFINLMTFRYVNSTWTGVNAVVDQIVLILAQSKFLSLFSMLFGLSFMLQVERAGETPFARRYLRRMGGLLLLGTAHYVLLWEGDILLYYVPAGVALLFFARRQPRTILIVALSLFTLFSVVAVVLTAASAESRANETEVKSNDMLLPIELYTRGTYGELVAARWQILPDRVFGVAFGSIFTLYVFLIGAYVGKRGILHRPAEHLPLLRRTVLWGLPMGLLFNAIVILTLPIRNSLPAATQAVLAVFLTPGVFILALAYGAGITLLSLRAKWLNVLAPVGRMSLTNYLMQTVIFTTLFYGYGVGWFGQVTPTGSVLLAVVVFAVQVIFSHWWLARFRYGPVEWVWRKFTYWQSSRSEPALTTPA